MKHFYTLLALLVATVGFAQIPTGYYSTATSTGYTLKTQLYNIISNHNDQGYNAMDGFIANYDLDYYYEIGSNTILDPYSENPTGADPYNFNAVGDQCGNYNSEGDCYNKEHVIPQSVFNSNTPMYSDAHHLLPTDGRVNGFRSNYPFGVVDNGSLVSQSGISNPTQNGSKLGGNLNSGYSAGYTGIVFEPIDEFKGDIARIYFYFVTRYEDQVSNWSNYPMFNGSSDKALDEPFLNILMTWHQNDPVSQKEIDRNNNIYYNHQSNRNPFVDHPEYVSMIWNPTIDTTAPTAPTNLVASNPTASSIDLTWTASTDDVAVTSYNIFVDGNFYTNTSTAVTNFTIIGLASETNYCFTIYALDAAGNTSTVSNQDCETTTNIPTDVNELFFSEYMEGSSNNKALEIANFTDTAISLTNYTLRLGSNGSSFGNDISFPPGASVAAGNVYVIINSGLSLSCNTEADYTNNTITGFNGNDAIGLFKNGTLIDIIGEEGNSSTYAQNTTLIRKETITNPTTSFSLSEWDSYIEPQNYCEDLGQHTVATLSTSFFKKSTIKIYPNPIKGNYLNADIKSTTNYQIYNILGKNISNGTLTNNNNTINVSNLKNGIYILKLETANSSITKKLIKE